MANYHLVILKKSYLDAIVEGRKLVESRFTKTRRGGFGHVTAGDTLFLKISSGPVCAVATVSVVKTFENLTPQKILQLKDKYNHQISGIDEYWKDKINSNFGFLVWFQDIKKIKPVKIKKNDLRAWVVLSKKENFGLLKHPSIIEM